jgi:secretion/DNA translocation related TadE-like protein
MTWAGGGVLGRFIARRQIARRGCTTIGRRDERGAASILVLGVLTVVIIMGVAGMIVGRCLILAHAARSAADLAAISGAAEFTRGGDPCLSARHMAAENRADLLNCSQVGDQFDFVITVRVSVGLGLLAPVPRAIEAVAHAGAESE